MNPLTAAIAVPSLLILIGLFFNRQEARSLRAEMKDGFNQVNARIDGVMGHLSTFYHLTGKLEGRVDELSKK